MENPEPIEIPILIVIATIGIIVFISFIVFFVLFYQKKALQNKALAEEKEKNHQRALVSLTLEVAETERKRIASNLHDDIGTTLSLTKININQMMRQSNSAHIKELGKESGLLLEATINNIRNISRDLAPPVLLRLGFEEGLKEFCKQIHSSGALAVDFLSHPDGSKLPERTELQLYRITTEVINNIIKHSGASAMRVELNDLKDKFVVMVRHNGKGIDNSTFTELASAGKGIGLKSIKSRADIINAKIDYVVIDPSAAAISIELLYEKTY